MKISIIIPSYNEGANVIRLAERLRPILESESYDMEVIYVDDSSDNTPELLLSLCHQDARFRYIHRESKRGLATAVLEGFRAAEGEWLMVMDADLQHPPEIIPEMIRTLELGYDMVIPSRFVPGGKDGGLSFPRKLVSWTARSIARATLKRARNITDPTSGIFAVRRQAVDNVYFNPVGWKIMLEILVRGKVNSAAEIPYTFISRDLGSSKMSMREQLRYLHHIGKLIFHSEEDLRFWTFCLVGGSGVIVNTAIYVGLVRLGVYVVLAFLLSSLVSMGSNFLLNNRFTWRQAKANPLWERILKFIKVSVGGIILSSGLVYALYHGLGVNYVLAGWLGIIGGIVWNYLLNDKWTFARIKKLKKAPAEKGLTESIGHQAGI